MTRLVILGAGGHGRVVADAAEAMGAWEEICFLDDRYPQLVRASAWTVIGCIADLDLIHREGDDHVVAIGDAQTRLRVINELVVGGKGLACVVHPRATLSRHAVVGEGVAVFAGACINIGAQLGRGVIVNTGATIDHDCRLGDGVHVCPGAHIAGDVHVDEGSWIGIGSCVRQGVRIGAWAVVGAGAVVVSDVGAHVTAVGVPARPKGDVPC